VLYLQVNKGNTASIAFYRRAGFEVTDSVKVDIGHGYVMDDFVMSKQLGTVAR
jgi:ribosomal protein S18 acetylase RimI-like enzyme